MKLHGIKPTQKTVINRVDAFCDRVVQAIKDSDNNFDTLCTEQADVFVGLLQDIVEIKPRIAAVKGAAVVELTEAKVHEKLETVRSLCFHIHNDDRERFSTDFKTLKQLRKV